MPTALVRCPGKTLVSLIAVLTFVVGLGLTAAAPAYAGTLIVQPTSYNYGNQRVGVGVQAVITVTNFGTVTQLNGTSLTGSGAGDFSVVGCAEWPVVLGSGEQCAITVTFTPSSVGSKAVTLSIQNSGGSAATAALSGTGVAPTADLSTALLAFGSARVGTQTLAQTVTLSNNGTANLSVGSTGASGDFGIDDGCANAMLASSSSCNIHVTFAPTTTGARTGTLTIQTELGARTVALSGTGVAPTADLSPTVIDFGSVPTGTQTSAQTVTLSNNGTANLSVGSTGASGDFGIDGGCANTSLTPSSNCEIQVTFTPTAMGTRTGTLTIQTDLGPRTVDLGGSGSDPTAPTVSLSTPNAPFTLASTALVSFAGQDPDSGVTAFQVRRKSAPWNGGFGAWEFPAAWSALTAGSLSVGLPAGRTSCYSVRSRNGAGRYSAWSAPRCTARVLDDRTMSASSGWTRATGSGYYLSTVTRATRRSVTLTRSSAQLSRVALVATKCPTCGVVGVYVGSTLIGRVNLARTTTANRVLIVLPAFALRTGTVKIKVLSSGKPVRIDGLGIFRAP